MMARPYKSPYKKRRLFRPGKDRVGGYYGRFQTHKGELKFHDLVVDSSPILEAGEIFSSLNNIPQGTGESQRIGRKCNLKSVEWRYNLQLPATDGVAVAAAGDNIRLIMYIDKQANGGVATVANILEIADDNSFYNLTNQNRFVILMDKNHDLNYITLAGAAANVSQSNVIHKYQFRKLCNIPVEFDGTDGTINEIRSNNLGLLLISSTGTGRIFSRIRVRYND